MLMLPWSKPSVILRLLHELDMRIGLRRSLCVRSGAALHTPDSNTRIRFIRSPAPVRMSMLLALWITSVAALEMGQQFPRHDVLDGYDNMLSVMVFPASEQQAAELDKAFKTVAGARDEFHVHGANVSFWGEPALLEYAHYGGQLRAEDAGLSPTGLAALISVTDNFTVEKVWEQTAARGLAQQTLDFILKTYHAEKEEQEEL